MPPTARQSVQQRRHALIYAIPPPLARAGEIVALCGCGRTFGPFPTWGDAEDAGATCLRCLAAGGEDLLAFAGVEINGSFLRT